MNIFSIFAFIATVASFLPIAVVLYQRLGTYKSFPALIAYFIPVFMYNLMIDGYVHVSKDVITATGLANNLLNAPLMLLFLSYFSTSNLFAKRLRWFTILYILFEIIMVVLNGFNFSTITIILGPGLFVVFGLIVYLFYKHSKVVVRSKKALGKCYMLGGLLFGFGLYLILYLLIYVSKSQEVKYTMFLYNLNLSISTIALCIGIVYERRRIDKLFETKQVRKELNEINKHEKRVIRVSNTPLLDFDRELWN
jgi:hypothetical protein